VRFAPFASLEFSTRTLRTQLPRKSHFALAEEATNVALRLLDANQDFALRASFRRLDDRGSRFLLERTSERERKREREPLGVFVLGYPPCHPTLMAVKVRH